MTIEEAIKILEDGGWWNFCDIPCDLSESKELHEALDMAISALRAQQEAEQAKEPIYPCTGCNNRWATYNSSGFTSCHRSCERLKAWWEQEKEAHNV